MQKLAEVCVRRPVFAVMLVMAMVVIGAVSYPKLGIDRFPDVDLPIISVRTTLLGASPEEIESTVTRRIEDAVATVEGITNIRSMSTESQSIVMVSFVLDRDIDTAAQDIRDAVSSSITLLPRDTKPPLIKKLDSDSAPIMTLVLAGDKTPRELYEIAERGVKEVIESAGGVGEVVINGGQKRAINVWIDANRLAAYKIPIIQVRDAVARQNSSIPGGRIAEGPRELVLRTLGRFPDAKNFNDLVVAVINNAPVRVRDIGYAVDGNKEQRTAASFDGRTAVAIEVRRQSGANTVQVIDGVKTRLEGIDKLLPPGVELQIVQDQSEYIEAAYHEVQLHLVLGSVLASLVVLLFMRNWRATVIAAVAIPASIIAAFGVMRWLNFTLNNITMLALTLMVGVVIDDAIVVLENIFRFVEEKKMPPMRAAVEATKDIGLAVMATTFSLIVVFLPVSFMSSVSGRFLYQFGFTATAAILVSLVISFSLTPMMSSRLLSVDETMKHGDSRRGLYGYIEKWYMAILEWSMQRRFVVSALAIAVMLSIVPLMDMVRTEYLPTNIDEGEFEVSISAPEGTSLPAMEGVLRRVYHELSELPGVDHVVTVVGTSYLQTVNYGRVYVRLEKLDDRVLSFTRLVKMTLEGRPQDAFKNIYSQRDVMAAVRQRLKQFPDLRVRVGNLRTFSTGSAPVDIDVAIRGPDLQSLYDYAERLRAAAEKIPGLVDTDTTLRLNKPEVRVVIDRDRAADLGVDAADVAESLRLMVGGDDEVSRFRDDKVAEEYDVEIRLQDTDRSSIESVAKLYVPSTKAGLVRLDSLVQVREDQTAYRIDGLDRQRQASVRANIVGDYALGDRMPEVFKAIEDLKMPMTYSTMMIGTGAEYDQTMRELILAFILSIVFMYMILASQFESLVHPITILLSLPLAVPFGILSLWLCGATLNLYSALGILVLFGVVKKNSILQVDHTNNLRRQQGLDRLTAILQANRDRLRPILMTTLTLVAGMLPLALGAGPGAEERRSIAIVVIGGQSLSLLLTLIVTPVAYSLFDDFGALFARRKREEAYTPAGAD